MAYLRNGYVASLIWEFLLTLYSNRTLREIHLWKILECLAKGALVLEQGHEGDYDPQYLHRPVAHFDIKPNNSELVRDILHNAMANRFAVLVGAQDNEHQELGVFKVGKRNRDPE